MVRLRLYLAAALLAVPLTAAAAAPAGACPTHGGCPGRCKVNSPVVVEGDTVSPSGRPLVECYY